MINFFKEKLQLKDRDDVIKLHIMIKSYEKGFNLSEADIDSLIELKNTGYGSKFFENCVEKGFYKSEQTVRNSIARMTNLGILFYKKRGERNINKEYIPEITEDKIVIQYLVANV